MLSDITYVTGKGRVSFDNAVVNEEKIIRMFTASLPSSPLLLLYCLKSNLLSYLTDQIEKLGFSAEAFSESSREETKFGISLPDDSIHPLFADDLVNSIQVLILPSLLSVYFLFILLPPTLTFTHLFSSSTVFSLIHRWNL